MSSAIRRCGGISCCLVLGCGRVDHAAPEYDWTEEEVTECHQVASPVACGGGPCELVYSTRLVCPGGLSDMRLEQSALLLQWFGAEPLPAPIFAMNSAGTLTEKVRYGPDLVRRVMTYADGEVVVAEGLEEGVRVQPFGLMFDGLVHLQQVRVVESTIFVLAEAAAGDPALVVRSQAPDKEPTELWRYPLAAQARFLSGLGPELIAVYDREVTPDEEELWDVDQPIRVLATSDFGTAVLYEGEAAIATKSFPVTLAQVVTPSGIVLERGDALSLMCDGPPTVGPSGECEPPSEETARVEGAYVSTVFGSGKHAWLASVMGHATYGCAFSACTSKGLSCGCSYHSQVADLEEQLQLVVEELGHADAPLRLRLSNFSAMFAITGSEWGDQAVVVSVANEASDPPRSIIDYLVLRR